MKEKLIAYYYEKIPEDYYSNFESFVPRDIFPIINHLDMLGEMIHRNTATALPKQKDRLNYILYTNPLCYANLIDGPHMAAITLEVLIPEDCADKNFPPELAKLIGKFHFKKVALDELLGKKPSKR